MISPFIYTLLISNMSKNIFNQYLNTVNIY